MRAKNNVSILYWLRDWFWNKIKNFNFQALIFILQSNVKYLIEMIYQEKNLIEFFLQII